MTTCIFKDCMKKVLLFLLLLSSVYANQNYEKGLNAYESNDIKKAEEFFQLAHNEGDFKASFYLGLMVATGESNIISQEKAGKYIKNSAEKGFDIAQTFIGEMSVKINNYVEAVKWFELAAENNNTMANYYLGMIYSEGEVGVLADRSKSFKYLKKAADKGLAEAEYELAKKYMNGKGVMENKKTAIQYFEKSAKQDYPPALNDLAFYYADTLSLFDRLVEPNLDKSLEMYKKAISLGYTRSKCDIAYPLIRKKNYNEAKKYLEEGYNDGEEHCKTIWDLNKLSEK